MRISHSIKDALMNYCYVVPFIVPIATVTTYSIPLHSILSTPLPRHGIHSSSDEASGCAKKVVRKENMLKAACESELRDELRDD